jgi:hypothetical protein
MKRKGFALALRLLPSSPIGPLKIRLKSSRMSDRHSTGLRATNKDYTYAKS